MGSGRLGLVGHRQLPLALRLPCLCHARPNASVWQAAAPSLAALASSTWQAAAPPLQLSPACATRILPILSRGSNHCVAICDGWVFDFNEPRALRMQDVAALDACCLHGAEYVAVYAGFQLTRGS